MHQVMQQLHAEHGNVAILLKFIRDEIARSESGESPDFIRLHQVMHYLTHYPDVFHHPREDLVFEKLLKKDASARTAISRLQREHVELTKSGRKLCRRLKEKTEGRRYHQSTLCRELIDYADFLDGHMQREEKKLFPLAKLLLSDADWSDVARCIHMREDPLFVDTASRPYAALLNSLERQTGRH